MDLICVSHVGHFSTEVIIMPQQHSREPSYSATGLGTLGTQNSATVTATVPQRNKRQQITQESKSCPVPRTRKSMITTDRK